MSRVRRYLRLRAFVLQHRGTEEALQAQRQMDALYPRLLRVELQEVRKGCIEQDAAQW